MKTIESNTGSHIYPGEYVPVMRQETIAQLIRSGHRQELHLPELTVEDLPHCFQVTLGVPGVKREDFTITAAGNRVSIFAIHQSAKSPPEYEYLERYVTLPKNADTAYITAEYKEDILHLYIPKTANRVSDTSSYVVVY